MLKTIWEDFTRSSRTKSLDNEFYRCDTIKTTMFGILAALILLFAPVSTAVVHAEDNATSTDTEVTTTKESTKSSTVREKIQDAVEVKKARIDEIRTNAKAEMDKRREEFKTKLTTIKDAKKKAIVERVTAKFEATNKKWVENWKERLSRLTKVMDKMDARADELTTKGKDTSAYETAAATARTKIKDASDALDAQLAKGYVPSITTETTLGTDVKTVASEFKTDVKAVEAAFKAAREAVRAAFTALKASAGAGAEVNKNGGE